MYICDMTEFEKFKVEIQTSIKLAMIAKNVILLETLRSINNALINAEKNNPGKQLNHIEILTGLAKQRQQSIDAFTKADNMELANKEAEELKYIEVYLPKKLTDTEITNIVTEMLSIEFTNVTTMKDQGQVINAFKTKYPGQNIAMVIATLKAKLV